MFASRASVERTEAPLNRENNLLQGAKICLYVKYCLQNKAVCYVITIKGKWCESHCSREDKEETKCDRSTKRSIPTESSGSLSHN